MRDRARKWGRAKTRIPTQTPRSRLLFKVMLCDCTYVVLAGWGIHGGFMEDSQDRESSRLADPAVPRCRGGGPEPWNEFGSIRKHLVLAYFSKSCCAIANTLCSLNEDLRGSHKAVNPLAFQTQPCPGAVVGARVPWNELDAIYKRLVLA